MQAHGQGQVPWPEAEQSKGSSQNGKVAAGLEAGQAQGCGMWGPS